MKRFLVPVACLFLLLGAAPAGSTQRGEGAPVVSIAGAKYYGYATPLVLVQKGSAVTYYNFDIEMHNVVQDAVEDGVASKKKQPWCRDFPRKLCPIFWSKQIGLGDAPIKGLEDIKPGTLYTFYCTLHPGMSGRLLALP